jgi:hypothetical protein
MDDSVIKEIIKDLIEEEVQRVMDIYINDLWEDLIHSVEELIEKHNEDKHQ